MSTIVLPGDSIQIPELSIDEDAVIKYGPGIYSENPLIQPIPCKAGIINHQSKRAAEIIYLDTNSKRYIPEVRDNVIGVVIAKNSEGYRVVLQDLSSPVQLGQFEFENASKKNRSNLTVGSLVYANVIQAERYIEAEISCVDQTTGKAAGYGELKGGHIIDVSLAYARYLMYNGGPVLAALGELAAFEIAIGVNGKIWINAEDVKTILKVSQCLEQGENWSPDQVKTNVSKVFSTK